MTKLRRKVDVEAVLVKDALRWAGSSWKELPSWLQDAYERGDILFLNNEVDVRVLGYRMKGQKEDWLVQEPLGGVSLCAASVFSSSYELVEAPVAGTQKPAEEPCEWERAAKQARRDLLDIESEILNKDQPAGVKVKWAEWSSPANTIRWIEKLTDEQGHCPSTPGEPGT